MSSSWGSGIGKELEVLGCLLLYQLNGGFFWMWAPLGTPHQFSVMILNDILRDGQTAIPGRRGEKVSNCGTTEEKKHLVSATLQRRISSTSSFLVHWPLSLFDCAHEKEDGT